MADENARWVVLPLEIAKQHPLYGVGGWLTLVILGSVVAPIRIVVSIGPLYRDMDFAALPGALAAFIAVEMAVNTAIVLWSIGNLFLALQKEPALSRILRIAHGGVGRLRDG